MEIKGQIAVREVLKYGCGKVAFHTKPDTKSLESSLIVRFHSLVE